ncbi:hypothetical protein MSMAP_2271 [Methanosarcina mazei SarPi]|uniref:Uncharacterized protein n=1 Tax=Methanosarcina mazei SarPi TaxID=1434115 RepID=A0A0E3LSS0_METMZ|nr:hypothetical protein MSMAP_2271 [Methanosarcina mazei SarPi]
MHQKDLSKRSLKKISQKDLSKRSLKKISQKDLSKRSLKKISQKGLFLYSYFITKGAQRVTNTPSFRVGMK